MCIVRFSLVGLVLVLALAMAGPAAAQQGILQGRVTDAETGRPVDAAQIQIRGGGEATGTLSNADGSYRIELPVGSYTVVVEYVGFRTGSFEDVSVRADQTTRYDIELTSNPVALNELVVTASRGVPEKQVDAPATTYLVGSQEIEEESVVTPVDHLRAAPGVDIITQGIQATNVVVRGFNNIFSGSLHALTDHRLAGVPSLRVNLLHFVPANDEDIDRMEVVLGPGSALYGPNTANGVLHILTKSPLDSASNGTTMSLAGGERSVFQGTFRTAFLVNRRLGVKFSGQYLSGDEWHYTDPVEEDARLSAQVDPGACQALLAVRGFDASTAQASCNRVGVRDFNTRRYGLEARTDYRFAEDGTAIFTYGRTSGTGIELTGLGAGQTDDWIYEFYQARMSKGRFFTQAYLNRSDAGNTFLLRDGVPLVDLSKLWVAQVQHGFSLFDERQDFTYGVDYFGTRPETKGTINGSYEDKDNMDEWGVYLQSKTALSPRFDLVLAGRLDSHSMLPDNVFSPRAALVFKPTEDQSIRFTYNRAFSTPSSLNFFLDISGGYAPAPLGALGYTIRAYGTGKDGYSFQNPDGSLKGMRSPFNPGGGAMLLPAQVQVMWPLAVGAAANIAAAKGTPLPASIVQLLGSLQPTGADIGISILDPNTNQVTPLSNATIPDVPGIHESHTETYEVGWQGVLGNRFRISADAYYEKKSDFTSPLIVRTPLLLLDGAGVGAYIQAPVFSALYQQFLGAGLDPAQAQAQAQAQAAVLVPQLAEALGSVPVGVVSSDEVAAQGADLIVTYINVGQIDLWGADLAFSWFLDDKWTLHGTYSHVSDDYFGVKGVVPGTTQYISLNAPKEKGTLGLAYRNPLSGISAEARVRVTGEFPAESAGYVGTECVTGGTGGIYEEACVESATLVDLTAGYKIRNTPATVQLSVTNLFDEAYRSFVGVPYVGRLALLRLKYDLF